MKAQAFLILVGKMLAAQQNYFNKGRKQSDLVTAKQLEKEAMAVVKIGKLEPDEPVPTATNLELFNRANFCLWTRDRHDEGWDTTCKQSFGSLVDDLEAFNFTFCPYCGKPIHEVKTIEAQEQS